MRTLYAHDIRWESQSVPDPDLPLLEAAHQLGARPAGLHQEREVRAGEDELHAHADVPLEKLRGVQAAHAGELAVLAAGGDHLLVGLGDARVAELAGDAHLEA